MVSATRRRGGARASRSGVYAKPEALAGLALRFGTGRVQSWATPWFATVTSVSALTLWLTGLSASGKSTLARAVAEALRQKGGACRILDGDELRRGLCSDLGYSRATRRENVRRVAEACRLLNQAGIPVVVALISPYRDDRQMARGIIGAETFREVWIAAPLEVCERRDPKGLYRRARTGELPGFTGIDDPSEAPASPPCWASAARNPFSDRAAAATSAVPNCVKLRGALVPRPGASGSSALTVPLCLLWARQRLFRQCHHA